MPVYEYACDKCGTRTEDYVLSWQERKEQLECSSCAATAAYVPSAFTVDFTSPGYKALLLEKGDIPYEPGIERDIARNKKDREARLSKQIKKTVEESLREVQTVTVNTSASAS